MIGPAPETLWGEMLVKVDKSLDDDIAFNTRLLPEASDEDKTDFEDYVMNFEGGREFLKQMFPKMKDPYYTWEGKIVERASLKGRKLPPAK